VKIESKKGRPEWKPASLDGHDVWRGMYRKHINTTTGKILYLKALAETRAIYINGVYFCDIIWELEPRKDEQNFSNST
jgi:hypothetical protein